MDWNCPQNDYSQYDYPQSYLLDSTFVRVQHDNSQPAPPFERWNYSQHNYPPNQSIQNNSNVNEIQNDNQPAASIEKFKRRSAELCADFFMNWSYPENYLNPDLNLDLERTEFFGDPYEVYENPNGNDENNKTFKEQQQKVVSDKKEPQIIKPKRKRIAKFKKHFTPGQPCTQATINLLRNRSQSKSPIPKSPTATFCSNGSSYENTYLNPQQPQYSRSCSLSPSPLSPSLSPSDFSSSASSSYCPQGGYFPFNGENQQQQQQSNQLYPQWNYDNNQYYSSENLSYDNNYRRSF
jgi:hypothetical protein